MDFNETFDFFKRLFSEEDRKQLKSIAEKLLNSLMVTERELYNGAEHYSHSEDRVSYSNGYKPRQLNTQSFGTLHLLHPQTRGDEPFHSKMFDYYQRSEKALAVTVGEIYVKGLSTRKISDLYREFFGTEISPQFISREAAKLEAKIEAWRKEPFTEAVPYIYADTMFVKVRQGDVVVSKGVLVASGIDENGNRRVLDYRVADTESEATYADLFSSLKERGLHGVEMVISDAHIGLQNAIARFFDGAAWQRCRFHFIKDFLDKIHNKEQKAEVARLMKIIYEQKTKTSALNRAEELAAYLREKKHTELAQNLMEHVAETLQYFASVKDNDGKNFDHQVDKLETALRKFSTSNHIERINRELRRRTDVVCIFPNAASLARLVGILLIEMDEEWRFGKKFVSFIKK